MFIIDFPKFKRYSGQDVSWLQIKCDGHLAKIHKGKTATIFSKNDKDLTNKAMSCKQVRQILDKLPMHTIAFGELWHPDYHATSVPTMLNDGDDELKLTIFAAPLFATRNLFNKPLDLVADIVSEYVEFVWTSKIETACIDSLLHRAMQVGQEGWVLKQAHMKGWYKLKPTNTVDAFVISTSRSFSANHYGEIKGVQIAVYKEDRVKVIADVGSGFEEEWRKSDPKSVIGMVCEVEYDEVAANGRLKFPRFIRWRQDKRKEECDYEQLG